MRVLNKNGAPHPSLSPRGCFPERRRGFLLSPSFNKLWITILARRGVEKKPCSKLQGISWIKFKKTKTIKTILFILSHSNLPLFSNHALTYPGPSLTK